MFARRGYNIQSLAVGNSEKEGMSRITMVIPGAAFSVDQDFYWLQRIVALISAFLVLHIREGDLVNHSTG